MKSRLVILSMLVLGMLLSTTGAGLAITSLSGDDASVAQYGGKTTPQSAPGAGDVLGEEDSGAGTQPSGGGGTSPSGGEDSGAQPARQAEAGTDTPSGSQLPFTGFAAVPILLGGLALLTIGLALRRRSSNER